MDDVYVKKHNKQETIVSLLTKLDSIFDGIDCALDCPCRTYCDNNVTRTLCTVIMMALSDLNR